MRLELSFKKSYGSGKFQNGFSVLMLVMADAFVCGCRIFVLEFVELYIIGATFYFN